MKPLRFLPGLLACLVSSFALSAEISGSIRQKGGKPIEGAVVKIYTAGLRSGSSPMCPSCWMDCRKSAVTDAGGNFHISGVDDQLVFRLLVFAEGYAPAYLTKVDPLKGPAKGELEARDLSAFPANQLIQGRITGPDGKPVAGAFLERQSPQTGLDAMAISDAGGHFVFTCGEPIRRNQIRVRAEGCAPANMRVPAATGTPSPLEIKLTRGVLVIGRVLDGGKPVKGVTMGAAQTDRSAERFLGAQEAVTGEDGRFTFFNAPAKEKMAIYGLMRSLGDRGAIPVRELVTGDNESTCQAGDFGIEKACRITGRLHLTDGKTFPAETRIGISLEVAWDGQIVDVSADGHFAAGGLPVGETLTVSVPRNHEIQSVTPPFEIDPLNSCVSGKVSGDILDFNIDLIGKEWATQERERYERQLRDQYKAFFKAENVPPEKIALFISARLTELAKLRKLMERKWDKDAARNIWKVREDEIKAGFGEDLYRKYFVFEATREGMSYVDYVAACHKGEWLTVGEKENLARAFGRELKKLRASNAPKNGRELTQEEEIAEWKRFFEKLWVAGTATLPPAKHATLRECLDLAYQRETAATKEEQ